MTSASEATAACANPSDRTARAMILSMLGSPEGGGNGAAVGLSGARSRTPAGVLGELAGAREGIDLPDQPVLDLEELDRQSEGVLGKLLRRHEHREAQHDTALHIREVVAAVLHDPVDRRLLHAVAAAPGEI